MKILVTGGSGLVGKAIQTIQNKYEYECQFISSKDCNLENFTETNNFISESKPDIIIHLAAYVGGLFRNMNEKVNMFEKNIIINYNLIKCAYQNNVKTCISCLSTCIFPDKTSYPINENMIHDGEPHNSNYGYAYAKRMLDIHNRVYREQYGLNYYCIIPTNIYGPNDNYSLNDGHVIPALIHKCYLAKLNNVPFVVKGSGTPLRQFIYSIDLAKLIIQCIENNINNNIILSVSEKDEISIKDVALEISKAFDYSNIIFDSAYSDGQMKKTADNSQLLKLFPEFKFTLFSDGIKESVDWFIDNFEYCRK